MPLTPRRSTSTNKNQVAKTPQAHVAASSSSATSKANNNTSKTPTGKVDTGRVKKYSSTENFNSKSSLAKLEQQLASLETKIGVQSSVHDETEDLLMMASSPSHLRDTSSSIERDEITAMTNSNNNNQNNNNNTNSDEQNRNEAVLTKKNLNALLRDEVDRENNETAALRQYELQVKPSSAPSSNQQQGQGQGQAQQQFSLPQPPPTSSRVSSNSVPAPPPTHSASARHHGERRFQRSRDLAATSNAAINSKIAQAQQQTNKTLAINNNRSQQHQRSSSSSSKNNNNKKDSSSSNGMVTTVSFSPRSTSSRTKAINEKNQQEVNNNTNEPAAATAVTLTRTPSMKLRMMKEQEQEQELNKNNDNNNSKQDPLARYDRLARSVSKTKDTSSFSPSPVRQQQQEINNKLNSNIKYTEDTYPWPEFTSEDAIVADCKVRGAMEKQGTGQYIYTFPKTGFFACRRCHKKFASASSKIAAEGGYASFEKYQVSNLKCDLVIPCASLAKQIREVKEKFPGKVSFIADATIAVSCQGCLANVGVLHPVKGHLMASSCAIAHCEVEKLYRGGDDDDGNDDDQFQQNEKRDSIFAEALAASGNHNKKSSSSPNGKSRDFVAGGRSDSRMSCRTTGSIIIGGIEIEQRNNNGNDDDDDEGEYESEDTDDEFPEATAATVLFATGF